MRERVVPTPATRWTLPAYCLLFGYIGAIFTYQAAERTDAPVYDVARSIMPIHMWGLLFVVVAIVDLVAILTQERVAFVLGLAFGAAVAAFWAVALGAPAFSDPHVSYTAGAWQALGAVAQVVTLHFTLTNSEDPA